MKVEVLYSYSAQEVPPRCRKVRSVVKEGKTTIEIREIKSVDAPVAIRAKGVIRFDASRPYVIDYRWFDGALWTAMSCINAEPNSLDANQNPEPYSRFPDVLDIRHERALEFGYYWFSDRPSEQDVLADISSMASSNLLIDGVPYRLAGEPRYVVMTFGLGHNHGGTACMVDSGYNSNIPHSRYFSLLNRSKALVLATQIASERGDTKSLPMTVNGPAIEVLIPEAIRVNPAVQHSDGDPFLNALDTITTSTASTQEAGLACLALAMSQV